MPLGATAQSWLCPEYITTANKLFTIDIFWHGLWNNTIIDLMQYNIKTEKADANFSKRFLWNVLTFK